MKTAQAEKIVNILNEIGIGISVDDIKDIDTIDELEEYLEDNNLFDVEIIYYTRAMNYLMDHDFSLQQSLELANDMGYSLDQLSSEILASLLASKNARDDFYDKRDEIERVINDE